MKSKTNSNTNNIKISKSNVTINPRVTLIQVLVSIITFERIEGRI